MFKPNFRIKVWRSNAFSQKLFILNAKKTQMRLFLSRRKYFSTLNSQYVYKSLKGYEDLNKNQKHMMS